MTRDKIRELVISAITDTGKLTEVVDELHKTISELEEVATEFDRISTEQYEAFLELSSK